MDPRLLFFVLEFLWVLLSVFLAARGMGRFP